MEFHKQCDNKPSILVICSSGKQIFGGYTPLKFHSDNSNVRDRDNKYSFLFSLNKLQKYKLEYTNYDSIRCFKDYGPCFSYDLEFVKNKMNMIKICKYVYDIPDNFLLKEDNIIKDKNSSEIILDSLEIFQIIQDKVK